MEIKCNEKLSNVFYSMTYDQFQRSLPYTEGFSKQEIEWALYEINYKYFGMYEFSDQQAMAVDILEWVAKQALAKEYLK